MNVNWLTYDAVILRSMWDYHLKSSLFDTWLDKLAIVGCYVMNPVSIARWNKNKKYFIELSEKGILLPAFYFCLTETDISLRTILEMKGWDKVVVKPAISGGSFETWRTTSTDDSLDESHFREMLKSGDVIVQKYIDEIVTEGELSLIYFNKIYSHAIRKKAKQGEFRVQTQFGGTTTPFQPSNDILHKAGDLLSMIKVRLLYARVDGVVGSDGGFYLMELELIEPNLYVRYDVNACENFYAALQSLIKVNA